ncbi:SLC13 family permease [Hominifimenecus sp. rT4P-3]|uniref:SLC13 family permease n=1 Tax=Hominifimenecus sp. rT4P-3 TaxID=3242979 RepID=UPI003DA1CE1C
MNTKKWIATIIGVLLLFGTRFLPPMFGLSELGMSVAGVFLGTIVLWLFVSVTWPSILCIVALITTPLYTYSAGLQASMGNWVVSFVLFSSMLSFGLGQTGFTKRAAVWFVTRPFTKKNPWMFLALLFLAPLVIGSFMSPIPAFMVFVPIAEQIFAELGYEKGDRFPQVVILGLLFFASLSTITTPIAHTVPILSMSLYEQDMTMPIDFVKYTIFGIVSAAVIFILSMLLVKYVFRPDMDRLKSLDSDVLKKGVAPMQLDEKLTLIVFGVVVAMWMLPGIIKPVLPGVAAAISSLGTPVPPMIGTVVLCLICIKGKPLMEFGQSIAKVPWGAVMMVAATSILGNALTNEDVGLTAVVVDALTPIISNMSPAFFVFIVCFFTLLITNFASNTVTVTLLYSISLPLVYGGAIAGVNPAALTCIIGAGASVALATPPSTAHAAIAAGTGWLKTDFMLKYGLLLSLLCVLVLSFVGYPIAAALM